ncbi:MAG: hypothetical protein JWO80_6445 [Bryobacterales bacterium]|nr:hypothetical protein [Bryobacterales bacterium]
MNLESIDWREVESSLWQYGYAKSAAPVLTRGECEELREIYGQPARFRSRVQMERFRFGEGDYQYFANPLPAIAEELRRVSYSHLAPTANRWMEALGFEDRYPAELDDFLTRCHAAGQTKPTPLMLHYEQGGYNCLHQDLYGAVVFPFQMVCFLSEPETDYTGGDFLLMEQRPRAQSVGDSIRAARGEVVIFTTRYRPVKGSRGFYRANVKHGVARLRTGTRYTLGIIFHDAAPTSQ